MAWFFVQNIALFKEIQFMFHYSRTGGLIAVLPNTPLVYYPDMENIQGLVVYFLSKILQLFGVEVCTPQAQGGVLLGLAVIFVFFCHFFLNYVGL